MIPCIEAGACGYILKTATQPKMVSAVIRAAEGQSPIDPALAKLLFDPTRPDPTGIRGTGIVPSSARNTSNGRRWCTVKGNRGETIGERCYTDQRVAPRLRPIRRRRPGTRHRRSISAKPSVTSFPLHESLSPAKQLALSVPSKVIPPSSSANLAPPLGSPD